MGSRLQPKQNSYRDAKLLQRNTKITTRRQNYYNGMKNQNQHDDKDMQNNYKPTPRGYKETKMTAKMQNEYERQKV